MKIGVRNFLQLRWLGRNRITSYSRILLLGVLPLLVHTFLEATSPTGSDFLAFWSAGKMVTAGTPALAYDPAALIQAQGRAGQGNVFAFVNPPPFLLISAPLGLLPYPAAWLLWIALGFAVWFVAMRPRARGLEWPLAAWPGALIAANHAQTGLLTGALLTGAANWLRARPWLAGLCIGALVIKPHLAVLMPIALLAGRHWKAIGGAAFGVALLAALTWLAFGSEVFLAYPKSWTVSRILIATGNADFFLRQSTVYAAVRVLVSAPIAMAVQGLVSLAMVALTWKVWTGDAALEGKLAFVMTATGLATPYLFNYDLPFLAIPSFWLFREAIERPRGGWERPLLLLFYLAPMYTRAFALPLHANLMPWVMMAMLFAIWRRLGTAPESVGTAG